MESHAERAAELFQMGYNCAQAVFCAYTDVTGLDLETAAHVSSGFGGGMGRMREVCGSVSGAFMVLGMVKGCADPNAREEKKALYALEQDFAARFRTENGSIICRELLAGVPVTQGSSPEERSPAYYKKRPCAEYVRYAAQLLEDYL